jgi:hypothetical protein
MWQSSYAFGCESIFCFPATFLLNAITAGKRLAVSECKSLIEQSVVLKAGV